MESTVERMKEAADELGIPCKLLDIETDDIKVADELVKKHGDWSPDYLIPQVFVEFADGSVKHVLTGDPRGLSFTRRAVDSFLGSRLYEDLRAVSAGHGKK